MTKGELLRMLKPFSDDIEIVLSECNPPSVTYSYTVEYLPPNKSSDGRVIIVCVNVSRSRL